MALCPFRVGDTQVFNIIVRNNEKQILDISNSYVITLMLKLSAKYSDGAGPPMALLSDPATIINGPLGMAQIVLDSDQTALLKPVQYYYEFRIQYTGLSPNVVGTLEFGKVNVLAGLNT